MTGYNGEADPGFAQVADELRVEVINMNHPSVTSEKLDFLSGQGVLVESEENGERVFGITAKHEDDLNGYLDILYGRGDHTAHQAVPPPIGTPTSVKTPSVAPSPESSYEKKKHANRRSSAAGLLAAAALPPGARLAVSVARRVAKPVAVVVLGGVIAWQTPAALDKVGDVVTEGVVCSIYKGNPVETRLLSKTIGLNWTFDICEKTDQPKPQGGR